MSCLILGGIYWHGCNIRSGAYKGQVGGRWWWGWEGGNRASVRKKHPEAQLFAKEATTSVTNHNRRQSECVGDDLGPCHPIKTPSGGPSLSVLAFQCFAWPQKKPCGKADLVTSCYLITVFWIVYECIYDMEQQNAVHTWLVFSNLVTCMYLLSP